MEKILELEHRGVTLKASHEVVVASILERLQGRSAPISVGPIPRIGEYWVGQGGVNAGLMRGMNGVPDYFLIVPPQDRVSIGKLEYGPRKSLSGVDDEYDGIKNTQALLATGDLYPAAKACAEFTLDGLKDFYLGARREYALAYANVSEQFVKDWHFTSTQCSVINAWGQYFDNGSQDGLGKGGECYVRPVRRLPAPSVI